MREPDKSQLIERLNIIEEMVAEGRRSTQRWGWMFLLWGIGPLLAIAWESRWPRPPLAWPVVLAVCVVVNGILVQMHNRKGEGQTAMARSLRAVWTCAGITMLLVTVSSVFSGFLELRTVYVVLFAVVAVAHGTSSMILRWRPQFLAAVGWWVIAIAALALPATRMRALSVAALAMNVLFGGWLTYREWSLGDE